VLVTGFQLPLIELKFYKILVIEPYLDFFNFKRRQFSKTEQVAMSESPKTNPFKEGINNLKLLFFLTNAARYPQ
jgi:hypothetical protein